MSAANAFNEGFESAFNGNCETFGNKYPCGSDEAMSWNDGYNNFFVQQDELARTAHRKLSITSTDPVLAALRAADIEAIGRQIGSAPDTWTSRCFEIAQKIVAAYGWTDARAIYGLYLGPISPRCKPFAGRQGTARHGWIITREGVIVDPTAWVFESVAPYLKVMVPGDDLHFECQEHYDEGAESMSSLARMGFPARRNGEKLVPISNQALRASVVRAIRASDITAKIPRGGFSSQQLSWICRTPYSDWGSKTAQALYKIVMDAGLDACIPMDFRARAQREAEWGVPG